MKHSNKIMNTPIIRLEVEGIKRSMIIALTEHQAQMDEDVRKAVESYCTPENITRIVDSATAKALNEAIQAEVKEFFWNGDGRKAVAAAVKESILKKESYTPLDNV